MQDIHLGPNGRLRGRALVPSPRDAVFQGLPFGYAALLGTLGTGQMKIEGIVDIWCPLGSGLEAAMQARRGVVARVETREDEDGKGMLVWWLRLRIKSHVSGDRRSV